MAIISLSQLSGQINQSIQVHEKLDEHLQQALALAHVAAASDLEHFSPCILHNYLWALSHLLEQAKALHRTLASDWCHLEKILKTQTETVPN